MKLSLLFNSDLIPNGYFRFGLKESHHAVTINYSEDGLYEEATCDCKDCSDRLGHQDHTLKQYERDSVYLYELDDFHKS